MVVSKGCQASSSKPRRTATVSLPVHSTPCCWAKTALSFLSFTQSNWLVMDKVDFANFSATCLATVLSCHSLKLNFLVTLSETFTEIAVLSSLRVEVPTSQVVCGPPFSGISLFLAAWLGWILILSLSILFTFLTALCICFLASLCMIFTLCCWNILGVIAGCVCFCFLISSRCLASFSLWIIALKLLSYAVREALTRRTSQALFTAVCASVAFSCLHLSGWQANDMET